MNIRTHVALNKLIKYEDELKKNGMALVWGVTLFGHNIPNSHFDRVVCERCGTPMRIPAEEWDSSHFCESCNPKHCFRR